VDTQLDTPIQADTKPDIPIEDLVQSSIQLEIPVEDPVQVDTHINTPADEPIVKVNTQLDTSAMPDIIDQHNGTTDAPLKEDTESDDNTINRPLVNAFGQVLF